MDCYSDSDDEVCWGPVTLKEVKNHLKRNYGYKPTNNRRTIGFNSPPQNKTEPKKLPTPEINILKTEMEQLSMNSQYFTPNETEASLKYLTVNETAASTDFITKVEHILNDSKTESFVTACNHSHVNEIDVDANDVLTPSKQKPSNLTQIAEAASASCVLDNFNITLENCPEEELGLTNTLQDIIKKLENDIEPEVTTVELSDDSVIELSSDDDCSFNKNNIVSSRYEGTQSKYEDISDANILEDSNLSEDIFYSEKFGTKENSFGDKLTEDESFEELKSHETNAKLNKSPPLFQNKSILERNSIEDENNLNPIMSPLAQKAIYNQKNSNTNNSELIRDYLDADSSQELENYKLDTLHEMSNENESELHTAHSNIVPTPSISVNNSNYNTSEDFRRSNLWQTNTTESPDGCNDMGYENKSELHRSHSEIVHKQSISDNNSNCNSPAVFRRSNLWQTKPTESPVTLYGLNDMDYDNKSELHSAHSEIVHKQSISANNSNCNSPAVFRRSNSWQSKTTESPVASYGSNNMDYENKFEFHSAHSDIVHKQSTSANNSNCNSPAVIQRSNSWQKKSTGSPDASFGFNDTLEEIERALKHGLDYTMSEEKPTARPAPAKTLKPRLRLPTKIPTPKSTTPNFKKPTLKTPASNSKNMFGHIQSPIAYYIKSTTTPLVQNMHSVYDNYFYAILKRHHFHVII